MELNNFGRSIILKLASNKVITDFVTKYGFNLGAKKFIAGKDLIDSIEVVKKLNMEGLIVTLDHVGESVKTREEAIKATDEAIKIFDIIDEFQLDSNVSIKLTQLGLLIDQDLCYNNVSKIVSRAKKYNNFARIDIEDASVVQMTIDIFKKAQLEYGNNYVGLALQSYLFRTEQDVIELGKLKTNLRIVKGAYKEAKEVAFPIKKDVDDNFIRIVELNLKNGNYTAIASHDKNIIDKIKIFAFENNIPKTQFEFQMLYGISNGLQRELVKEGYNVRVYTPYGIHWYPYFSRRIAERPANAMFVLKGLFK